eukprot:2704531-Lingulodinium_polyedra.AAC.1
MARRRAKGGHASTTLCLAAHWAEPTVPVSVDPAFSRPVAAWEGWAPHVVMRAAWRNRIRYILRPG